MKAKRVPRDRDAGAGGPVTRVGSSYLRRGLQAIEALAVRPRTAAELARELRVNRSTALRLLLDLEAAGYVSRDAKSKLFATVAERFYPLVAKHQEDHDWSELIDPLLSSLRDEFGESTMFAVPAKGSMVYMAFFPSPHPVSVRERLGSVRPMHSSALGKAYLAALDPESLDVELGRWSFEGGTPAAAKGPIELRKRLGETRTRGYAIDRDETFEGVRCIATSIWIGGSMVGSVGLSAPSSRLPDGSIREVGPRLVKRLLELNGRSSWAGNLIPGS